MPIPSLKIALVTPYEQDYVDIRALLSEMEGGGNELFRLPSYQEGLDSMVQGEYGLYLLAYHLDGNYNGLNLLSEAISRGCHLPLILLIEQVDWEIDLQAIRAGAADCWVKDQLHPFHLEKSLRHALERAHLPQGLPENEAPLHLAPSNEMTKEFLDAIMDNIPHPIFIKEAEKLSHVFWNKANERMIGLERAKAMGKTDYDLFPRTQADSFRTQDREALATGKLIDIPEQPLQTARKEIRILRTRKIPISDSEGKVCYLLGVSEDITERKRLEEQIRNSLERRSREVRTSTEVAQQIAAAPVLDKLFQRVVNLMQERFRYYYVHVYTLEPLPPVGEEAYLVMQAGTSEAGQMMKTAGHKIPLSAERSLVALAARLGEPMLVSDVYQEPAWLPNALLPETRSELAVPIKLGDRVLGVLDVQSRRVDGLTQEDQLLLTGLCGQIAVAIDYRRTEEQLQFQKTLLECQSEADLDGILIVSEDRRWLSFNQRFIEMWKIPEEVIKERSSKVAIEVLKENLVDPDQFQKIMDYLYAHPDEVIHDELIFKDGRVFERYSAPVKSATGIYYGRVWNYRDITERKQAEAALARQAEEMAAVSQTLLEINAELDIPLLLQAIIRRAATLLGASMGTLLLVKPDQITLEVVAIYNRPESEMGLTLKLGEGLAGHVIQTGEPFMLSNYRYWSRKTAHFADQPVGRILGVPLQHGPQTIGVLNIFDQDPGTFSEENVQLLSLFAAYGAIAIQNARLFEAEQRQREIAETLGEVARVVNSSLALNEVLDQALIELEAILLYDTAHVLLVTAENARMVASRYFFGWEELSGVDIPMTNLPLSAKAVHQRQPLLFPDTQQEPLFKPALQGSAPVRCLILIPLISREEVIGLLGVASYQPYRYSVEDVDIAFRFGQQVVSAIKNARLYEQVQLQNLELEQRVAERTAELATAQEQLVHQEKLAVLGQLAGGVAHELRNPLGVISNSVFLLNLLLTEAEPMAKEYLEIIEGHIREAEYIISALLDLSRTQLAKQIKTDMAELVREALRHYPSLDPVRVRIDLATELPPVWVAPDQIKQVLVNLVTNACQAMPEGGDLTITAQAEPDGVRLSVADTGIGMSQEILSKIFEPLFTTKARGIGLGLSVSKNLMDVNGGRIEVESMVGQGSTFSLIFPLKETA